MSVLAVWPSQQLQQLKLPMDSLRVRRSQRKIPTVDYSQLHSIGTTKMAENNNLVDTEEEFLEEFEEGQGPEEDPDVWEARREAVSDENYKREYDAFQQKMQELNE